ncbi:uncharacterized protein P884DRAFT_259937 [Thermothelomyces heterothallicus CBS 202.75]|uniref:uncharacterized protein n=1 Tax=Thermothelomyces heterothallicus CBS 202.75 TaxID=1149848 RepID=UPI0037433D0A
MMTDDEIPAQPKKKALPFKRTVARKQQSQKPQQPSEEAKKADDDNDLDFFRHTDEVFPEILREVSEGKDQENHDRKRRKLSSPPDDPQRSHKQPVTLDESDNDLIMDVKGKGKEIPRPRRPSTPLQTSTAREVSESPGSSRTTPRTAVSRRSLSKNTAGSPGAPVTVLASDVSDSDDVGVVKPAAPSNKREASKPTTPGRSRGTSSTSSSPIEILPNPDPDPNPPSGDDFSEWVAKARALQASESHTAVVEVLTTSRIEGCDKPVRTRCRMNQAVQIILKAWIERTRSSRTVIPDDVAARMFLTWKGNKIYGHSTLASLGVQVDAKGRLRNNQGEGYTRDGIHLEVWTEEEYAAYLETRGKKRASRLLAADEDDDDDSGVDDRRGASGGAEEAPAPARQRKKKGIRIVLKAKDHEPLKLTTREDTTVEMLIEAFRAQRNLGPEWDVAMWFDGERLEEDSLVTDLDVDPDDVNQLEVHVKRGGS